MRAFRARQRGEREPATFEAALLDGDQLARAIDHSRQLQAELAEAVDSLADAEAAVRAEHRRHLATQRKLERTLADLGRCRASAEHQVEELRIVRDELDALKAEERVLRAQRAQSSGPNRAARRQAAKRDRRTDR